MGLLVAGVMVASWALTGLVRRYASSRSVLDRPTERSAHRIPTPRGGGLAVAASVFAGLGVAVALGRVDDSLALALVGGGGAVAVAGWIDDRRGLAPSSRLMVHVAAATFAVVVLGGLPRAGLWGGVDLGWAGSIVAILGVVWSINLYNFMDGLDGLAATEALQVGAAGAILCFGAGDGSGGAAAAIIAGAAAGFLPWNWAPARIFLGDVGSGLLGFLFGVLALGTERAGGVPIGAWVILLAVFGFDATVTLVRRVLRGARWDTPHRCHAYQRLAGAGWSHPAVVGAIATFNLWLAGLAAVAVRWPPAALFAGLAAAGTVAAAYLAVERVSPWPLDQRGAPA